MSAKHQSDLLANKVKSLIVADDREDSEPLNRGHPWSVAKLLLLGQWADVYSTIIKSYFRSYRFVDLLAGAGRTRIEETEGKLIKGSVFAVDTFAQEYPFSKYVLVEDDLEKYEALKRRTRVFGERCEVIHEDCNKVVEEVFAKYSDHNLVFIDNQGFNVGWKSIKAIMHAKADMIINYPTSMFERVACDPKSSEKLDEFFGDDSWRTAKFDRKLSVKIYMSKLENAYEEIKKPTAAKKVKAYVNNIRLGDKKFFYDIILVCREGEYTNVWEKMKERWNEKNCRCLVDFINGKTPCLDVLKDLAGKYPSLKRNTQSSTIFSKEKCE